PLPEPPGAALTVALVSRMLKSKGVPEAAAAVRRLRAQGCAVELVLAGQPDPANDDSLDEAELRRLAAEPGIEWLGPVADVRTVWQRAGLAVYPSTYGEGVPASLLEAAACARPIVAADMPGAREVVRPGETGLLVPPGDVERLAAAIAELARDPRARRPRRDPRRHRRGASGAGAAPGRAAAHRRALRPRPRHRAGGDDRAGPGAGAAPRPCRGRGMGLCRRHFHVQLQPVCVGFRRPGLARHGDAARRDQPVHRLGRASPARGAPPMTTLCYTHSACLLHDPGPHHPESPARLEAVLAALSGPRFAALERREAPEAAIEDLVRVHSRRLVEALLDAVPQQGYAAIDADTVMSPASGAAALRAAGAVVAAVDAVVAGEAASAFCAVRPPGHHAEPNRPMGFCLFNNVAVGALRARA